MEEFFGNILVALADYWWLIAAALVVIHFIQPNGVEEAIDEFKPENNLGGGRFADNKALRKANLFGGKGITVGISPDGWHTLHYPGQGHILTVCAARGGKGVSLLIPAMLDWKGSLFVIDPKAENAAVTGHYRRRFGKVYVLNPFNLFPEELSGLKQARYNPMDILDPKSPSFHIDCDKIAAGMIVEEGRDGQHWVTGARILVSGIIAALTRHAPPERRNLVEVGRIVGSGDGLFTFCREAMQSKDEFIHTKLASFAAEKAEESREIGDVIRTAVVQMNFISNAAIGASLKASDFRFRDLKRKPGTTVYICLPLSKLDVCDKYFRLIVECFLAELLNERRGKPVLAIIDEMAQLGPYMKSLENAQGMISGAAGLIIWGVLQSLVQLQGMFPRTWQTFIQNAGVTMWFGARDIETREFVSKLSGTREVITRSRTANIDRQTGSVVLSESGGQHSRPVLLPHEVGELNKDEMIMFVEGVNGPIRARRKPYWKIGRYAGRYRRNPYVGKSGGGILGALFG